MMTLNGETMLKASSCRPISTPKSRGPESGNMSFDGATNGHSVYEADVLAREFHAAGL